MTYLRLLRLSLAELFALVTFVALSCVALLSSTDRTAWIVGGSLWLALLVSIAASITPRLERRPFFLGFLIAAVLHLVLMQFVARRGQSNYDIDLPTFYLIEVMWNAVPEEHWPKPEPARIVRLPNGSSFMTSPARSLRERAHANFQGIATQLFTIFYGMLTGFLAQGLSRWKDAAAPPAAARDIEK